MVRWARGRGMGVTFIEVMPLGDVDATRFDQNLPLTQVRIGMLLLWSDHKAQSERVFHQCTVDPAPPQTDKVYDNVFYHMEGEGCMGRGPKALRGTKIKFKGASALGFGASWDISNADRDGVRGILTFLEDRRVLYIAQNLEVTGEVERSVHDIRMQCTQALTAISERSAARRHIRAIRAACRRFLEEPRPEYRNLVPHHFGRFVDEASFFTALGELRASVGAEIAALAAYYEIEIEPELASILSS